MNLNEYDDVREKVDKSKSWIDVKHKRLFSREISLRKYVTIVKRYKPEIDEYFYFIITLDEIPLNKSYEELTVDNYGRLKLSLSSIWCQSKLCSLTQDKNVTINHIEHETDGDVYQISI